MKKQANAARRDFHTLGALILIFAALWIAQSAGALSYTARSMLIPVCCWCLMAISLNLTVGILGELSLGHAGFMSVGAFAGVSVCQLLRVWLGWSDLPALLLSLVAAALAAALVGLLIGLPVLRLRGDYLAIVTLAFGQIIMSVLGNLYFGLSDCSPVFSLIRPISYGESKVEIIRGPTGMTNLPKLTTFPLAFVVLLLCLIVIFNLIRSRTGRAIMALRDNRIAAESIGINVTANKLLVFSLSAAMAGMAGVLYTFNQGTVTASKFDYNQSIMVLVFVVLGGLGSMRGSLIAAALLTILSTLLNEYSSYRMLIYALVLIAVMLLTNNEAAKRRLASLIPRRKAVPLGERGKGGKENG